MVCLLSEAISVLFRGEGYAVWSCWEAGIAVCPIAVSVCSPGSVAPPFTPLSGKGEQAGPVALLPSALRQIVPIKTQRIALKWIVSVRYYSEREVFLLLQ